MMEKIYKVGDWVWYATYDSEEIKVPCPVCYGNKVVTVVLGNEDEVAVECDYCGKGWQNARGYVTEYQRIPKAEQRMITKRRIEDGRDGEEIEYVGGSYILRVEQMFETEKEAYNYAVGLAEKATQEALDKTKYKQEKSYTWNAGYHMKAAKDRRREAEYHEAKAKICKSKAKE